MSREESEIDLKRLLGVAQAPILARLSGISYLGCFNFFFKTREPFNRLEHSIGTAKLLAAILDSAGQDIGAHEKRAIVLAGLLHDAGHVIFSHTGESALKIRQKFDHEENIQGIRENDTLLASLEDNGVGWGDIDQATIDHKVLLKSHLDADTLQGIPHTAEILLNAENIAKIPLSHARNLEAPTKAQVLELVTTKLLYRDGDWFWDSSAIPIIEGFWAQKGVIYQDFVSAPQLLAAEAMLQKAILCSGEFSHSISQDEFWALAHSLPHANRIAIELKKQDWWVPLPGDLSRGYDDGLAKIISDPDLYRAWLGAYESTEYPPKRIHLLNFTQKIFDSNWAHAGKLLDVKPRSNQLISWLEVEEALNRSYVAKKVPTIYVAPELASSTVAQREIWEVTKKFIDYL